MKRFGLIGKSLKHSFSPSYYQKKFSDEGLADHIYQAFEIQNIGEFPALLTKFPDLAGLNVTIPYKSGIIQFLDEKDDLVKISGACNCIRIRNGKLKGFNTDIAGFMASVQPYIKPYHTKALILGTGGGSKAVMYGLKELNIPFQTVSRDQTKGNLTYAEIDENILNEFQIVINTTPMGMFPHEETFPDIPYQFVTSHHLFFDLVYNPAKTIFLAKAEEKGAVIVNGYQMLVIQAEENWKIWNAE